MAQDFFDVQAALLFNARPQVDEQVFRAWFVELARDHGLAGSFSVMPGVAGPGSIWIAGGGIHATISIQNKPLDPKAFELPLKSPILRHRKFDFKGAIAAHTAAIVIQVGDGELSMPAAQRQLMGDEGIVDAADPILKLQVLHLVAQGLTTMCRPTMIDFCPSQLLLTPPEMAMVSSMALPIPILFHPFPVGNGRDEMGVPRTGMAAIHAPMLIGAELELEAVPEDMSVAARIDLLASLITDHRAGNVSLEHGDVLELLGGREQWVRHEASGAADGHLRIIVSFDTQPSEQSAASKKKSMDGHRAFQDRIAKLKSKSAQAKIPLHAAVRPAAETEAGLSGETQEELRERIQDTISPGGTGTSGVASAGGSFKLLFAVLVIGLFVFLIPGEDMNDLISGQLSSVSALMSDFGGGSVASAASDGDNHQIVNTVKDALR
ncbi:MAG: hypothetical protein AAF665_07400 [Pseudomonadota bacterium]